MPGQLYNLDARVFGGDVDDKVRLSANPAKGWIVHSLEIVVSYKSNNYLLLTHPQYSVYDEVSDGPPKQVLGFWACPYFALAVSMPSYHSINTVGQARRFMSDAYDKVRRERLYEDLLGNFVFHNSLRSFEYLPELLEFKISPRNKKSHRLYKIIRMAPNDWDEESIYDLTDPHFLKGNYFMGIDEIEHDANADADIRFHGRPLMPNIVHVLKNRRSLCPPQTVKPIATEESHWVERCEGMLVSIDLRGFEGLMGSLRRYSFNPQGAPDRTIDDARGMIVSLFCELSRKVGTGQLFTAGDGCILGFPSSEADAIEEAYQYLEDVLDHIMTSGRHEVFTNYPLHFRVSVLKGSYRFGRIAGPLSLEASFDGEDMTRLARLDEGHRAVIEGTDTGILSLGVEQELGRLLMPRLAQRFELQKIRENEHKTKAGNDIGMSIYAQRFSGKVDMS